ncbi:MAG: thiamine diphosphokinase [Anaerolineales bacterium]|nr:thiamine diphosphokinase [Anaerolineales bacterium]
MDNQEFYIIANGELPSRELRIPEEAFLIAADGGGRHCLRLGLKPRIVIGDFDSLSPAEIATIEQAGAELIRYPADKDQTDLELALELALARGAQTIKLYGLLGGRWDMSFANLLLLAAPRYDALQLSVWSAKTEVHILRGGESLVLSGAPGDTISAIPIHGPANGLSYQGMLWPLENADLPAGTPRGVSNRLTAPQAVIRLEQGRLLLFHLHQTKQVD